LPHAPCLYPEIGAGPVEVVILAGGRGTRALPWTEDRAKGMLPLAGRPLIEHVMRIYADQGFSSFILALGHRGEDIERHLAGAATGWTIRSSRAGQEAGTGARLRAAVALSSGTVLATYGDGLADIDLRALLARHREAGRIGTLTVTVTRSQFGTVELDPSMLVREFREKPVIPDVWINAGFFVFEAQGLADRAGESLEEDVLPSLAAEGQLAAYRHEGFWRSVDTFKDLEDIERSVAEGRATWAGLRASGSS
jgi:glucose-1-phosphate cytidylyltransferase